MGLTASNLYYVSRFKPHMLKMFILVEHVTHQLLANSSFSTDHLSTYECVDKSAIKCFEFEFNKI